MSGVIERWSLMRRKESQADRVAETEVVGIVSGIE